ncbi:MAG: DUF885 domain-containing protein [Bacteroidia bacterium]|nr:DUF885 domain-containing protein [Bacteroidia bacterium]MBP7715480.1 DUF885 domain-containing protein [Bacteroidia bacterium]MBP8667638.1 DUF885 domain-containing protein [Bacteroidia bacterium]HQW16710.1 DUF885 domain-containing protein [Bacteroidia bacterium]HQW48113.1 DUF885 domain-containing protein [Bacteroidia bacterium]
MRKYFILLVVVFCMDSTNLFAGKESSVTDKRFDSFKERFIKDLWKHNPMWATEIGFHAYDSILEINNEQYRNGQVAFSKSYLDSLKTFDKVALSSLNRMDYGLIENYLNSNIFYITEMKGWQWNPSSYNATGNVAFMLSENYEPLNKRLVNIGKKLSQFKSYYEVAKKNIANPTDEHLKLAMEQNAGGIAALETDLLDSLKQSTLKADVKLNITQSLTDAKKAVEDYIAFLKDFKNENPRSFRLGKDLYAKKFEYEIQSQYTYQQIYDSAMQRKSYLHNEMFKISDKLWSKYFGTKAKPVDSLAMIKMMIDTISVRHVKPDEFQSAIEKQLPELVKFINEKNLIYIDPSKPLKVRREPAYMAGVAGASISSPGPYDKGGNTYYNVGSLSGWSAERAESYLREYNHYILQILNIHEAIPGHYTQLVYSNNAPSIIKAVFGNGAMIEGWAVYGELMMLENGYGDNEPEMWLMYYKWNLRTVCNTILDISVHTKDMTEAQALNLLENEAFQQKAEAQGKWRRVSVTNVQLTSYYTGFKEIYDLREELKKKMGSKFNLKAFHEKFLSYGSAPVKMIREEMLSEIK